MRYYLSIILVLFAVTFRLSAQHIQVQAPSNVYEGQQFTVHFVVDARANNFRGPSFKGLSVQSGPNQSSSSSVSIINGNVSKSVSNTFTYLILADQPGTFTIGSASCTAEGKQLSSEPFTIHVEKADPQQIARQQQQQQARQQQRRSRDPFAALFGDPWDDGQAAQQQQQQQPVSLDSKTLFARASISKNNLYQGEQAIITYKIYTQVPISQYQIDKLPGNKGFWAEDLSENQIIKQYEETIDGKRYQVAEIRRGALFAQEHGSLRIAPIDLDVLAMVQRPRRRTGSIFDFFDDAFFNPAQAVEKHLTSNAINVNVKPLPDAPEGYNGAVGSFQASAETNTQQVKAGEAITYKLTIKGSGNLVLITEPSINFSSAFEVYDPQVKDNITHSDAGISGSRTYEWIIIPQSEGEYEIPAFNFSYFDPKTGKYVSQLLPAIPIKVEKGDPNAMHNMSSSKNNVSLIGNDINYIKTGACSWSKLDETTPIWFWISLAAIIVTTISVVVGGRKHQEDLKDIAGMRQKRATREARKRLKKAASFLSDGNDNRFYEEIYKAIWGCLADHYKIPLSSLSSDTVRESMACHQVPAEKQESVIQTLANVDYARFAPGDSTSRKQQTYDEALSLISAI
ncbi:MAG: protein BatD [Bacteroidales bacterium]|nr:protein BatD [Candidatus Colimorpha onthohippi]